MRRVEHKLTGAKTGRGTLPQASSGVHGDPLSRPHSVGQGTFRARIMDVYERQCAVTRERALPVLDAAHIRPVRVEPANYVQNGLLLRCDVRRLFDAGYFTVTPEYHAQVSRRIRQDFHDGESYLKLHGTPIFVPKRSDDRPDPEALAWHNLNRFRG